MTEGEDGLHDDPSIPNEGRILRRIPPGSWSPRVDGGKRPNSDTFSDDEDGECCVDLEIDDGQPERTLMGHPDFGLVALAVGEIRAQGLGVIPRPLKDNPAHALITGNKTHGRRKRLSLASVWLKKPSR